MFKDCDIDNSLITKPVDYNHDKAPFLRSYAFQRIQRVCVSG